MIDIASSTILLLLIMDPLGNLPIFMSILKNLDIKRQKYILIRELTIALFIMILFLFAGEKILTYLNLKTATVSISGGIILFLISIKMIFPDQNSKNNFILNEEPFLVPLAIPLVAGPSLLATLMLLSHKYQNHISTILISLLVAWGLTSIILLLSGLFLKILGDKGINVLERLMGLILIMLATQMFLDGIRNYLHI